MNIVYITAACISFMFTFGGILIALGRVLQRVDLLTDTLKELKVDIKYMSEHMFDSQQRLTVVETKIRDKRVS